jgi:hypothetical protein
MAHGLKEFWASGIVKAKISKCGKLTVSRQLIAHSLDA